MNYEDYYTPEWCFEKLDKLIDFSRYKIALEPCSGDGRIANWLRKKNINITEFDLQQGQNYLKIPSENIKVDLIITNPPYSKAQKFVEKALKESDDILMLLRLGFLASQERHKFWIENPLSKLIVLSKRPSFKYGRTDNSDYAWFFWTKRIVKANIEHYPL